MGPLTDTTQHNKQEERPTTMRYTSAKMGPRTDTTQQEGRPATMGYTRAQTGPQTDIHNTTGTTGHFGIH
jgi:hypothetical protein